jgi:hypothetical protein
MGDNVVNGAIPCDEAQLDGERSGFILTSRQGRRKRLAAGQQLAQLALQEI